MGIMEVTYPESRCELSPNHAHFFVPLIGTIWRCKYCWATKWIPATLDDAVKFTTRIRRMGLDEAYQKSLQSRPTIRRKLGELEEIRLLRKAGLPQEELMIAMAAIMTGEIC